VPELPEVETIRRGLAKFILNKKIVQIRIASTSSKSFLLSDDLNQKNVIPLVHVRDIHFFDSNLEKVQSDKRNDLLVTGLRRFGKALIIDLSNGYSLMIHLRMTGQLIWRGEENFAAGHPSENFVAELPNKQTRVIFEFEDGTLYFNDQRKFGFVKVIETKRVLEDEFIKKLAKEPWDMEAGELYEKLQRHRMRRLKR